MHVNTKYDTFLLHATQTNTRSQQAAKGLGLRHAFENTEYVHRTEKKSNHAR